VDEICAPPAVVGVEVGAGYPFEWPFRRLHRSWPGGLPYEEIRERLAYAAKLGATELYLLGGEVALRPELPALLEEARRLGARRITLETTAFPFSEPVYAQRLKHLGLTVGVVEVLAGSGHPERRDEVARGVVALREAGVSLSAKLVLGQDDRPAFQAALAWIEALELRLDTMVLLDPSDEGWVRGEVGPDVEVELVD